MTPYTEFTYLAPPRTEFTIPRSLLNVYEVKGWLCQAKKNGSNSVVFVPPDRQPFAYNRHGERHKTWAFTPQSAALFAAIPGGRWYVFNGELLHAKVKGGPKDVHYCYDLLCEAGELLVGATYESRCARMEAVLRRAAHALRCPVAETPTHTVLNAHTWLAKSFRTGFRDLFDGLQGGENEGVVIKDPKGVYQTSDAARASWMVKCRRATKTLGF